MGNTLTPAEARQRPLVHTALNISHDPSLATSSYTLILADPDSTAKTGASGVDVKQSGPIDFVHYIVSGLRLPSDHADFSQLDLDKGNEILPYLGPSFSSKSGKHRFVYILFKEQSSSAVKSPGSSILSNKNGSNISEDSTGNALATSDTPERIAFGAGLCVKQWALKHSLAPVAVNFYYAQGETQ